MEQERDRERRQVRQKTPTRNSRAAQVAQRRREEKKERARLENLREKQSRKAKRRNRVRKRISRESLKRMIIMAGIVLAVVLSMLIFFRVRGIEVQGTAYYQPQDILNAAGVEKGDNLLILSRAEIAGNVLEKLPYVESVRVTRRLPDTVIITVTEYDATYAVADEKGDYYLITASGKATEKITAAKAGEHIRIENVTIETPTIGEAVTVMAPLGQEVAAQGQLTALKKVLAAIETYGLQQTIRSVSVPNSYEITAWYEDRFYVELGDTEDLDYKFQFLIQAVDSQKSYATGSIDLTQTADHKAIVSLDPE